MRPAAGREHCPPPSGIIHIPTPTRTRSTLTSIRSLAVAASLLALPAAAQEAACPAGTIAEIFIDNGSVFDAGSPDLDSRFAWAYRTANKLHVRTRRSVIRRELLFREGECYAAERLEDSERVLRALPFIADADVFAVAQPDGSQHVVVETRDDWSFRLEPQWDADERVGLAGVELREDNLLGTGQHVSGYVKRHQGERVYGVAVATRQLLGTGLHADLRVERTPVGTAVVQRLAYPFRGESGRWAFLQQLEHQDRNFEYYVPGEEGRAARRYFPEERRGFDLGAVFRLGRRGSLTLVGGGLAGEWTVYPREYLSGGGGQASPRDGADSLPLVTGLDTLSAVRVVLLAGQRNVTFARRRALDAVRGAEDVQLGFEMEASVGRSIVGLSRDDDLHGAVGITLSGEVGSLLWGFRGTAEGRREFGPGSGRSEWSNLFGQADGWAYWRPGDDSRHTVVGAVAVVGGWRTSVPFQLTLGNRAGMRGLPSHSYPGERRTVATLEHRMYLGWPYPRLFDLGSAAFVDVGKSWVGGDAFGERSPVEASAGLGLRLAFPPGSRRTYRIDVAAPLTGGTAFGDVVVTLGVGQAVGRSVRDDPQLRRSSRRPLAASLFRFPN